MTPHEILSLPMANNDAGAKTVRDYIVSLAATIWREGEGFSSKRPFGNSDWEFELYEPLITAGVVEGDKHDEPIDRGAADLLISSAIEALR